MAPSLDLRILLECNRLVPSSGIGREIVDAIGNNSLIRGFPIFFPIFALWLSAKGEQRRARMSAGVIAACIATVISVQMQHHFGLHVRPFLDSTLHVPNMHVSQLENWDRVNSFPSDTATLFFALSTMVLLESRWAGIIAFAWSVLSVGVLRVAMGWHYPSDVLGAAVLGPPMVLLFERSKFVTGLFGRLFERCKAYPAAIDAAMFIILADAYNLFNGLQDIYIHLSRIAKELLTH